MYHYAAKGVEEIDSGLAAALLEQSGELQGRLRLSIPPHFIPIWSIISDFKSCYPHIQFEIFVTSRHIDFIEDGIDLALRVGNIFHPTSIVRHLLSYRRVLVASPSFLQERVIDSVQSLLYQPCAAWGSRYKEVKWQLGDETLHLQPEIYSNDYMHIQYMALNGQCITELLPFLCQHHIATGSLVEVLPDYPFPEQAISITYPSRKSITHPQRVFLDYCAEHLRADQMTAEGE